LTSEAKRQQSFQGLDDSTRKVFYSSMTNQEARGSPSTQHHGTLTPSFFTSRASRHALLRLIIWQRKKHLLSLPEPYYINQVKARPTERRPPRPPPLPTPPHHIHTAPCPYLRTPTPSSFIRVECQHRLTALWSKPTDHITHTTSTASWTTRATTPHLRSSGSSPPSRTS
jgi:hypothetical protein